MAEAAGNVLAECDIGEQREQHDSQSEADRAPAQLQAQHEQRRSGDQVAGRELRKAGDPIGIARLVDDEPERGGKAHGSERVIDRGQPLDPRMRGRGEKADREQQQEIVEDLKLLGGGGVEREPADDENGENGEHCHQDAKRSARTHPLGLAQQLDQAIVAGAPSGHCVRSGCGGGYFNKPTSR